jgi:Na+-transporting NADH:ubiquinone oxidoreductase subunit C
VTNTVQTLTFATVLGVTCSVLLVGASRFTEPYRKANEKAEEVRNFLAALEAPVPEGATAADLLAIFEASVRKEARDGLTLYAYVPAGAEEAVALAVPFSGAGVWGPIEGVLALEPDQTTIRGVRFYKQEETPGLGGEIASDWFQEQFRGRKIVSASGTPGFRVRKPGTLSDDNVVDAITGATMTSDRVESMLDGLARRLRGEK